MAILLLAASAFGQSWVHPFDFPQNQSCPHEVVAVIEIPAGSYIKYELDTATGHVVVDRFQSVPMFYPANYGVITQSLAGDGDNLDVLVYTRTPVQAGAIISVRPIGILKMLDAGLEDDKVIAVPTTNVDPTYAEIKSVEDLPVIERERLEFFFRTYKTLPQGRKRVELRGVQSAENARAIIRSAVASYARSKRLSPAPCMEPAGQIEVYESEPGKGTT
ncbi:MAG TPA: inorganic diphosphatase [Aridibacter sp.]|nr:inorganic diphosphatase [Aridibacter sp.]